MENKWNLDLNDWVIREKKNNRDVIQIEEMRTTFSKLSKSTPTALNRNFKLNCIA